MKGLLIICTVTILNDFLGTGRTPSFIFLQGLRCMLQWLWSIYTSGKHVCEMYYPLNPTLYRKTGVCRGIPYFLIFVRKHTVWVLVRTALARRGSSNVYPLWLCVLSKNIKNILFFLMIIFNFYNLRTICISHGHVFVMTELKCGQLWFPCQRHILWLRYMLRWLVNQPSTELK